VEDDELVLELQSNMLNAKFPDVVIHKAANGRLGLELFNKHLPEIVLTDINMTELCGVKMSENIRAIKPDTKIIAITGRDSEEITVGFDHIVMKPVDLSELFAVVEQCIGEIAIT
jgi:YesN/AraC family two-component response regulator